MVEKNMQSIFKQYLELHPPVQTEVYELKICKNNAIPFDAVRDHQIDALMRVDRGSFYHKIQDSPVSWGVNTQMRFTKKKPFDCLVLVQVSAFVVIWFYHKGQKKVFIKIPIARFLKEEEESMRKSLTEERALEIGEAIEL